MSGRPLEVGEVAAMLADPFYAVEIHPSLCRRHEQVMSEATWIRSNSHAIDLLGAAAWCRRHLDALKDDHGEAWRHADREHVVADPYPAITLHRALCAPHEPLIDEELWIRVGARAIAEDQDGYLHNLVSVLKGAHVPA
jgi:hypothetical protein